MKRWDETWIEKILKMNKIKVQCGDFQGNITLPCYEAFKSPNLNRWTWCVAGLQHQQSPGD